MGIPLEASRSGCALHGALYSALAIEGVVPIIHSTSGCGVQSHLGGDLCSGWSGTGFIGGSEIPSSNISEKQIVFGGSSRLREQIKNTVKVVSGDLYVVLSGCAAEMVGDDIPAMAKEAREQGFPVINISTPGFRGSAHRGYELFLKEIIAQLEPPADSPSHTVAGLINVLGIVPVQDAYWEGNLDEIASLLASADLHANTLFGHGSTLEGLHNLRSAQLSLVFSSWGLAAARELETRFGIPWINVAALPVGAEEAARLLEMVATALLLNPDRVTSVTNDIRKREGYFLRKLAEAYYLQGWQREFAIVGDSATAVGIATFLTTTLGLLPMVVIITDNPNDQIRSALVEKLEKLLPDFDTQVLFSEDGGEITDALLQSPSGLILGSSLERGVARQLQIPLVEISFPITGQLLLDKRHAGSRGALALLEDVGRAILLSQDGDIP